MRGRQSELYRVYQVGGRVFSVFLKFDKQLGESYPAYPDFEKSPEYTDEGRPFATAEQESCSEAESATPGAPVPGDCGGCRWFYRETTPFDLIGICICEACRRVNKSE